MKQCVQIETSAGLDALHDALLDRARKAGIVKRSQFARRAP